MGRIVRTDELFGSVDAGDQEESQKPDFRQTSGGKRIFSTKALFGDTLDEPSSPKPASGKKIFKTSDLFGGENPQPVIDLNPAQEEAKKHKANFLEKMVWTNWAGIPEEAIEDYKSREWSPSEKIAQTLLGPFAAAIPGQAGRGARETLAMGLAPLSEVYNRFMERPISSQLVPLAKTMFLGEPLPEAEAPEIIQKYLPGIAGNKKTWGALRNLMQAYFTIKPQEIKDISGYKFREERAEIGDILRARNLAMGIPSEIGEPLAALGGLAARSLMPDAFIGAKKVAQKTPGAIKTTAELAKEAAETAGTVVTETAKAIPGAVKAGAKAAGEAVAGTIKGGLQGAVNQIDELYKTFKGTTSKQTFVKQMVQKGLSRDEALKLHNAFDDFIKENAPEQMITPEYATRRLFPGVQDRPAVIVSAEKNPAADLKSVVDEVRAQTKELEQTVETMIKDKKPVPPKLLENIEKLKASVPQVEGERAQGYEKPKQEQTEETAPPEAKPAVAETATPSQDEDPKKKQAWEITKEEWMAQRPSGTSPGMHSWEVEKAVKRGEKVPQDVLKDYPYLQKKPVTPQVKQGVEGTTPLGVKPSTEGMSPVLKYQTEYENYLKDPKSFDEPSIPEALAKNPEALANIKKSAQGNVAEEERDLSKKKMTAYEYGQAAFKAGKKAISAQDADFRNSGLLAQGDVTKKLDDWNKGWHEANMDAPVYDPETGEQIAGKKEESKSPLDEFEKSGKEPWQVTQKEWVDIMRGHMRSLGQPEESGTRAAPYSDYEQFHKRAVEDALAQGKKVPIDVQVEYGYAKREGNIVIRKANIVPTRGGVVAVPQKVSGEVIRTPGGYVAVPEKVKEEGRQTEDKWYHGGAKGLTSIADGWATQDKNMAQNFADRIVGGGQVYEVSAENVTQPNKTEKIGKIKAGSKVKPSESQEKSPKAEESATIKPEGKDDGKETTGAEGRGAGASEERSVTAESERTPGDAESSGERALAGGSERSTGSSDSGLLRRADGGDRVQGRGRDNEDVPAQEEDVDVKEALNQAADKIESDKPAEYDGNYRISETDKIGQGTPKQKYRANLTAIKLLKKIESEGRQATKEEQAVLVKYVGWGGMPQAFDPNSQAWTSEYQELKNILDEKEYEAARASTINAHYTSDMIINSMWKAIKRFGFTHGRVLEPAMGVGHFLGLRPIKNISMTGVELDSITGRIARQIYQEADIHVKGFETVDLSQNAYDLAISNVPFSSYKPFDKRSKELGIPKGLSLHDFFFAKALALVKPGGVVAFITSRYTLDKQSPYVRDLLAEKADFVGAIRLPRTAFKGNAGTEVTTDIIFLRKKIPGADLKGEGWTKSVSRQLDGTEVFLNEYYQKHPEMILGEERLGKGLYSDKEYTVYANEDTPLEDQLDVAIKKLPKDIVVKAQKAAEEARESEKLKEMLPSNLKIGNFFERDGKIFQFTKDDEAEEVQLDAKGKLRVLDFIEIRTHARQLLYDQKSDTSDSIIQEQIKKVSKLYDNFVKRHGYFNDRGNEILLESDPDYYFIAAQEIQDPKTKKYSKSNFFKVRVARPYKRPTKADSIKDALFISLNETGVIDTKRISELVGRSEEKVTNELMASQYIFENPDTGDFEEESEYLSGNVRIKLKQAENAGPKYSRNAEALKKIIPQDLKPTEIEVNVGDNWISPDDYEQFLTDLLDMQKGNVTYAQKGYNGSVEVTTRYGAWSEKINRIYGVPYRGFSAIDLFQKIANKSPIVVKKKDSEGKEWVDETLTTEAKAKAEQLKEEFRSWIWKNVDRTKRLTEKYNNDRNSIVPRKYDGDHLTFPGMSPEITLRKNQKNAIWRIIQKKGSLLSHEVGAGKTFTMIAAGMELKRLGLVQKPLFLVPNAIIGQWGKDFQKLYPGANVLVADEKNFNAKRRQKFLARSATGDWDAIIMTHPNMQKIDVSFETYERHIGERIAEYREFLQEAKNNEETKKSRSVKQVEEAIKKLESRVKEKLAQERDAVIKFEELGVDMAFVDEAHEYKNLAYQTTLKGVKGLGSPGGNDKTEDLLMKIRHLQEMNNGRGVVFATGTPILNTMAEIYNFMKYLQPDVIRDLNMRHFDQWLRAFGDVVTRMEVSSVGSGVKQSTRLSKLTNVPELLRLILPMWDNYTSKMLMEDGILVPGENLPLVKNGKPSGTIASKSRTLARYIIHLRKRELAIKGKKPEKGMDNILTIINDGMKAAIDPRIVMPGAEDNPNSKLNLVISGVIKGWINGKESKTTQAVFIDNLSTGLYKKKTATEQVVEEVADLEDFDLEDDDDDTGDINLEFNPFDEMVKKWTKAGIPKEEIAFVWDAKNKNDRQAMFDKVKRGEIRVIVGSTKKLGVGANIQDRLEAVWHLGIPWRPGDLTQREGRIIRQGNKNEMVRIYRMSTEGSFDVYMWQTLEAKAGVIEKMMRGDLTIRSFDEELNDFSVIKAMSAENPLVMEKYNIDMDVNRLQTLKKSQLAGYLAQREELESLPRLIEKQKANIKATNERLATLPEKAPTEDTGLSIKVNGKTFTKRDEAGKQIFTNFERVRAGNQTQYIATTGTSIGEVLGHDLFAYGGLLPSVRILYKGSMVGEAGSDSPSGLVTKALNQIFDRSGIKQSEVWISTAEKRISEIKANPLSDTFSKEAELKKAISRQKEIETQLAGQGVDTKVSEAEKLAKDEAALDDFKENPPQGVDWMESDTDRQLKQAGFIRLGKDDKTNDEIQGVQFSDPDVEKRFRESHGMRTPEHYLAKVRQFFEDTKSLFRVYRHLPETREFFPLKQILGKQKNSRPIAQHNAIRAINAITSKFGPKKYDLFTRKVILDDLVREAEAGRPVPFGYSEIDPDSGKLVIRTELLEKDKAMIDDLIEKNPDIAEAVQKRKQLWDAITRDLVKYKILKGDQVKEDYFRHQILEYAATRATFGTGKKLRQPSPGYAKRRQGSSLDINTNYIEAEFEVLSQSLHDIETAKRILEIEGSKYNVLPQLKDQAKKHNEEAIREYFADVIVKEQAKGNPDFLMMTADDLYKSTLNVKQAIGFAKLQKLAEGGDLPTGDNMEFEGLVNAMANGEDDEVESGEIFRYLGYLMKTEDAAGKLAAGLVFKGMAEKKKFIYETLGPKFKTWEDFIPEGFTTWQPKEGRVFYTTYSVPQRVINEALSEIDPGLGEFGVTKDMLKKIIAVGGPRKQLVVKDEVAATLDELFISKPEGALRNALKTLTTWWKKWVLFNPRRAFKYNLQNQIGDIDAVLAGQPKIFQNTLRAAKELHQVMILGKQMPPEMNEFFERGGLTSELTVQEIPDINKIHLFERLHKEADRLRLQGKPFLERLNWWLNTMGHLSAFRESILRYAAYLYYRDVFQSGEVEFGASNPEEVLSMTDPLDRAAKVATELLGDYANVTAFTAEARELLIPFASWMEINLKRYYRLFKNEFSGAGGTGAAARSAGVLSKKAAFSLARFWIRIAGLSFAAMLWNQTFFSEEEDNLSEYDRNRMHLILGKTKDGRIIVMRGQGAFADALEWFGLNEAPQLLRETFEGKSSLQEVFGKIPFVTGEIGLAPAVMKLARAVNPAFKLPYEYLVGYTLPFLGDRPSKIEDRTRHLLRVLQLENEYDFVANKPSRGYAKSLFEVFINVQDPNENAYRAVQAMKWDYLERRKGRGGSGSYYSPKSILVRNLKKAMAYKDAAAEKRIMGELGKLGVTVKDLRDSLETSHPLYGLSKADKNDFVTNYLSPRDKLKLKRAEDYYQNTFR